jgi:signal transduction histidine kinase
MNLRKKLIEVESNLFGRILLIFTFAFVLVITIIYLALQSINDLESSMHRVMRTQEVLTKFDQVLSIMKDAETGQRGFLLSGDSVFLRPYHNSQKEIYREMSQLRALVEDNEEQMTRINRLESLIWKKRVLLGMNLNQPTVNQETLFQGMLVMDSIRSEVQSSKDIEVQLMKERIENLHVSRKETKATIIVLSLVALALVIIPLVVSMLELRKRLVIQELLDSVLNSSLNGIQSFEAIRDLDGNIIDFRFIQANAASHQMARAYPGTMEGKTLFEVFPYLRSNPLVQQYKQVVDTGTLLDMEYETHLNGYSEWYRVIAAKLRDGFTLTLQDITSEKKNALELQSNLVALERSNKELEQFAYVASHDLQEPLRKILVFIDRLKMRNAEQLNEEYLGYIDRISNSAKRMSDLINDLLSYSRVGSEKHEIIPVDLNQLVQEVLTDYELIIQQKSAKVEVGNLPVIEGVRVQLQQLFQNLISNSLKFIDDKRDPLVTIRSEELSDAEYRGHNTKSTGSKMHWYRIYVSDNGIGFENKYTEKIFQIFQRLHGRSEFQGTGIGLAICKKIVENHHGTIDAKSDPGSGAIFIITLPVSQA